MLGLMLSREYNYIPLIKVRCLNRAWLRNKCQVYIHALNISLIRSEMWKADDSSSNISFPICQNNKPKCMYFNPEKQTDHVN